MSKIVYLIGFMGVGKTSVGEWVKRSEGITSYEAIDLDTYIEKVEGTTIEGLFGSYGEEYFREVEARILKEVSESFRARPIKKTYIISCGGGIVLRDSNIEIMKQCGIVAWLTASTLSIQNRVTNDQTPRPALKNCKSLKDMEQLIMERNKQYEKAADFIVSTDGLTTDEIWENIKSNIV
ncbi:MAG: shikimate kinase [Lachnospiraceae bacterium]